MVRQSEKINEDLILAEDNKKTPEQQGEEKPEMKLLEEAFMAFNVATEKLESSYNVLQEEAKKLREEVEEKNKKLSDLTGLLESVLNNSLSSIVAVDDDMNILTKNPSAEKLIEETGEGEFFSMLEKLGKPGVYEYEPVDGEFWKISVGELKSDSFSGFVYVIDDITHIKRLEVEKTRDEKLKLMGEMAANIAHEIRNPLGSIELFASLLGRDVEKEPNKKKLTDSIVKGVRTINAIISNILLFTKEIQIEKDRYFVADIVDDVILYLQHLMRDKNISFHNTIDEDHCMYCDGELLKQVVMNIIHNAVDAVQEGGQVKISSFAEDGFSGFAIEDNGTGISKEMTKKLFMPFQTTKAKGTGLGLAIVYKIVKSHGGNIELDSDGASFTKFTVSLPIKK